MSMQWYENEVRQLREQVDQLRAEVNCLRALNAELVEALRRAKSNIPSGLAHAIAEADAILAKAAKSASIVPADTKTA
jgi:cell division septum initiation protein DivIVA